MSALTNLPDDMFQGSGANFKTLGFEYWANPKNRDEGFITWQSNGQPSVRMGASAVGPDPETEVSQRLIPEEPMVRHGLSSSVVFTDCMRSVVHHSELGYLL